MGAQGGFPGAFGAEVFADFASWPFVAERDLSGVSGEKGAFPRPFGSQRELPGPFGAMAASSGPFDESEVDISMSFSSAIEFFLKLLTCSFKSVI